MHRMIIEIITMKTQIEETEDKRKTTKGKKTVTLFIWQQTIDKGDAVRLNKVHPAYSMLLRTFGTLDFCHVTEQKYLTSTLK